MEEQPFPLPPSRPRHEPWADDCLAGLQAGMLGGAVMLGWAILACWARGQSAWTIPNLLAATFHGGQTYRPDFLWRTWSGFGLHFVFSGALGIVFAVARPRSRHRWLGPSLGVIYALLLYWLAAPRFWERVNPPLGLYSRQSFMLAGYCLYGLSLGTVDWFAAPRLPLLKGLDADQPVDGPIHA